jgi:hypothetical protein
LLRGKEKNLVNGFLGRTKKEVLPRGVWGIEARKSGSLEVGKPDGRYGIIGGRIESW